MIGHDPDEREAAWFTVHGLLRAGWHVGPAGYDPDIGLWRVVAWTRSPGRRTKLETIEGTGVDELAAVRDLADRLRTVPGSTTS